MICEFSSAYSQILNQLNYIESVEEFYAYTIDNRVYFEMHDRMYDEEGELTALEYPLTNKEEYYFKLDGVGKRSFIIKHMLSMTPAKTCHLNMDEAENAVMHTSLILYNPRLQYNYGMCWACAVATTYNYLYSAAITGFDVCNALSIGYDAGGTIVNEKDGLNHYGVTYNYMRYITHINSGMLMRADSIAYNINHSYPVILNGSSNSGNHAVTIYGYSKINNAYTFEYFDSAASIVSNGYKTFSWSVGYFQTGSSSSNTCSVMSCLQKYPYY